jgi:hypothetical protein
MGKKIEVIIVRNKGTAFLIQTRESRDRYFIPKDWVRPSIASESKEIYEIDSDNLELAIPYGIDWNDNLEDFIIRKADLIDALKDNGIWTAEDFLKNPAAVKGAISASASDLLRRLNAVVDVYRMKEN